MNMPLKKSETAIAVPAAPATAKVLTLGKLKRTPIGDRALAHASNIAARVVPPLIVITLILLIWELLCNRPGATLPPPSRVIKDTWELIVDPFFDRGGIDKGLFWHLSASLQRVAFGYALAATVGVALGAGLAGSEYLVDA